MLDPFLPETRRAVWEKVKRGYRPPCPRLVFGRSRRRRGRVADRPLMNRGTAAAATRIFRGDESRRRRGCDADVPWRRVGATPRPRRTFRGDESHRRYFDAGIEMFWLDDAEPRPVRLSTRGWVHPTKEAAATSSTAGRAGRTSTPPGLNTAVGSPSTAARSGRTGGSRRSPKGCNARGWNRR